MGLNLLNSNFILHLRKIQFCIEKLFQPSKFSIDAIHM